MYAWKMYIVPTIATLKPTEINSSMKWWQWASKDNGNMEKQEFNGTVDDWSKKLETKCSHFLRHIFIKMNAIMCF